MEPATTKQPLVSDSSVSTNQPSTTNQLTTADQPAATNLTTPVDQSTTINQPTAVDSSVSTNQSVAVDQPVTPTATNSPTSTDQSLPIPQPVPETISQTVTADQSTITNQPTTAEQPVTAKPTTTVDQPTTINQPAVVDPPAATNQTPINQPATAQPPVAVDQPVATNQPPATINQPVVVDQPVTVHQSLITPQPVSEAISHPVAADQSLLTPQPVPQAVIQPVPSPKKNKTFVLGLVTILIVALLGTGSFVAYQKVGPQSQPRAEVFIPTFMPTMPVSSAFESSQSAEWKTYNNQAFNYEIQYPSLWTTRTASSSTDYVFFEPPNKVKDESDGTIQIGAQTFSAMDVNSNSEAQKVFNNFMKSVNPGTGRLNEEVYHLEKETTIAGMLAFQTTGGCCMDIGRHIFLYSKSRQLVFTLYDLAIASHSASPNQSIFEQMLSTFAFTDQKQASISSR